MLHSSNIEVLQASLLLQAKQKLFCSLTVLTIILNALEHLCEEYCFVGCDAMCLIKIYTSDECAASIFSYLFYREYGGRACSPEKKNKFSTNLHRITLQKTGVFIVPTVTTSALMNINQCALSKGSKAIFPKYLIKMLCHLVYKFIVCMC